MLDIKFIRENPSKVQKAAEEKRVKVNIDHLLKIDREYRELLTTVQGLREERNRLAKSASNAVEAARSQYIEEGRKHKVELEQKEHALSALKEELDTELLKIPNLPKDDVKVGKDELDNDVIRKHKTPTKFSFKEKDHLELGEALDIIDVQRAAKVSGARFAYLKN